MKSLSVLLAGLAGVACSGARYGGPDQAPGVTFPAPIAEGKRVREGFDGDRPGVARDAGAPAPAPAVIPPALPDPEPLRLARQWQYDVAYDAGRLRISAVKALVFSQPVVTSRQMGRFAIELWIGHELVDRVRFDFPLLAAEEPGTVRRRPFKEPPTFAAAASVKRRVLVPASPRATRAVLLDRATGSIRELPWPPDAPLAAAVADAAVMP